MNNIPQKPYKPLTPFGLFIRHNFPFVEATYEARDNYDLLCKVYQQLKTVEYNQKIGEENIEALYEFLNTLDLQDEVNNKLDEMAESGQLQEIMAEYLNSKAVFGFDNVADLKSATNLIDGSYAETLGYTTKNDCGGGLYKIRTITNEDVVDNASIIPLNDSTLIAELITNKEITPEQFGCIGDNQTNDTTALQKCFNYASNNSCKIILSNKYLINDDIEIERGTSLEGKTLNAGIYGNNNKIIITGGSQYTGYVDNSDLMEFKNIYFKKITIVLGDTINDFGMGLSFNKCILFGDNEDIDGFIIKNNCWIFTINDCKITNYQNGINFKFQNENSSYVVNSGASIKISNTDIFNCDNAIYSIGSATDGYDIQITNCDFEHCEYSIYSENGRGNNYNITNLHIEGNEIGSIYSDATNFYINNIWDFDSNPNTYIAKYTAVNNGKIIINSGRINFTTEKLVKNIDSRVYMNLNEIVIPQFIYNNHILTNDSTRGIITPDGYVFSVPNSVVTKEYSATDIETLGVIEVGSNNGFEFDVFLRQTGSLASETTPSFTVFMSSTTGTVGISIPFNPNNANAHINIIYKEHLLKVSCDYIIDGQTTSTHFEDYRFITTDTITAQKTIQLRYNNGIGTVQTKGLIAKHINGYSLT